MNRKSRHIDKNIAPPKIKETLAYSAGFHVIIFIIAAFGLPFMSPPPLEISPPINVEILDIADITQSNNIAPAQTIKEQPPEEVKEEVVEEIKKPPPPPEPEEVVEEAVPEPEPKEEKSPVKKPKEKPKPPKEEPKKEEPKKDLDRFASLLKDLTPDEVTPTEPQDNETLSDSGAQTSQIAQLSNKMTISELDAFKQQLAPCWNVPAGVKYAEQLVIATRVFMNRDGTVRSASILDQSRYNRESNFRAAADSALRALRNPRCQPLKLPADKYDEWKTIIIRFDPSEML